ncbi:hypothetical protein [Bradyrhizobium guangxiense]|uniref:hypothetical protein n=1 Tax=Bradyrhizobium guangxiense TaxID=1325115 RepID=UPI0013E8A9A7|nr:hypothetical protein [Bradyrhizobium guangxiense]
MAKKKSTTLRDLSGAASSTNAAEPVKLLSKNSNINNELYFVVPPEEDAGRGTNGQLAPTSAVSRTKKPKGKQMSVYLEPSLHKRLREYAHKKEIKMHPIIIEGIIMALDKREALIEE